MSLLDSLVTVEYHNKKYTVAGIQHSNNIIPILLDREIYKTIRKLNKRWYINDKNHIYCIHNQNNTDNMNIVYLHEVVMRLNPEVNKNLINKRPIIHINKIHFDNRMENLQFDVPNKDHSKNTRKKHRIIDLDKYNINVNNLPTYMWYLKPDQTHGDRFVIEFPNGISWRTTSSKKVSLRYKLEEAKKYLRYMKVQRPDLFDAYSMNGDMTAQGHRLLREYNMMIGKAGYTMGTKIEKDNTDMILEPDISDLTSTEIEMLDEFNPTI